MTTRVHAARAGLFAGVLACAAAGAFSTAPALAQAQDAPETNLTGQILTGLGLVAPPPPDIDYRERPPLVVPPTGDILPPPRDASAISQNPAWPKDHDQVVREAEAKANWVDTRATSSRVGEARSLTPAELNKGYRSGKATGSGFANNGRANQDNRLSVNEMGFLGWDSKKDDTIRFEGEPERASLTEPPPGYQTPAPGAKYGVVADRPEDKAWKLPNLFDRTQKNSD